MEITTMIRLRRLRCSFCRKNNDQVGKLVAGPRVYICDECVAIASRMMENDSHDNDHKNRDQRTIWLRLMDRVRQAWALVRRGALAQGGKRFNIEIGHSSSVNSQVGKVDPVPASRLNAAHYQY